MAKKREKEAKAEVKGTETTTKGKKVMKAEIESKVDQTAFRKMINPILTKNQNLVLVENKWGAVQVKRDGQLLFSNRKMGVIITHPMYDGKTRIFKHAGDAYDNLSVVPQSKLTVKMLEARVADNKQLKDYVAQFYGKDMTKCGLVKRAEVMKKRLEGLKSEATDKTSKKTKKTEAIQKTSDKKSAKVTVPAKKATKAIKKVAAEVA
jgi:hypothetical protein